MTLREREVRHRATRRDVLWGAAAGLVVAAGPARAQTRDPRPPVFRTVHAQFTLIEPRVDVRQVVLRRLGGGEVALASHAGRVVLLNFWASWCPPCRRELPILHRLQVTSPRPGIVVAPVSLDADPAAAAAFLRRLDLPGFTSFTDADGAVASGPTARRAAPFALYGMPMSYVIDAQGRSVGYLKGEADWTSPEALALLRHFLA